MQRSWQWYAWWSIWGVVSALLIGWYMVGGPAVALPAVMIALLVGGLSLMPQSTWMFRLVYVALWVSALLLIWYVSIRQHAAPPT